MSRTVVFVFGSNLAGRHGKGAALEARNHWGASHGHGEGRIGRSYAIPTKDEKLRVIPLNVIKKYWDDFYDYAKRNPEIQFLLTPFGTGLSNYTIDDVKSIMTQPPLRNIWKTGDWEK